MEELRITRRAVATTLGGFPAESAEGRLRLLGWRARRGWFGRSGLWALVPLDRGGARGQPRSSRQLAPTDQPPSLSRIAPVDLEVAFRNRGEVALLHIAYSGRAVASVAFRIGALCLGACLPTALLVPVIPGLLALVGLTSLGVAAVAKTVSLLAAIPAHTTRALRLQRWAAAGASSPAVDGDRVRVRGRITALRTVPALDGRPAVFVRVRATRRGRGADLQNAEDFLLDDGSGTPTRVQVGNALFLDRPVRAFGSWVSAPLEAFPFLPAGMIPIDLEEAALHEGDEVEIIGRAEMIVDPTLTDRLGRTTPLVRVLSGTPDEPVLVRSVL